MGTVIVWRSGPSRGLWTVGFLLVGTVLPDLDMVLPIAHHGVSHTFVGAVVSSVGLGLLVVGLAVAYGYVRDVGSPSAVDRLGLLKTSSIALCIGQFSNIAIDLVSAPSGNPVPLHPLWPFWDGKVKTVPVMSVHSELWNYGLLLVGSVVFVVAYWIVHRDTVRTRLR